MHSLIRNLKNRSCLMLFFCLVINLTDAQILTEVKVSAISDSLLPFESFYGKLSFAITKTNGDYSIFDIENDLKDNLHVNYSWDTFNVKLDCSIATVFRHNNSWTIDNQLIHARDSLEFIFCVPLVQNSILGDNIGGKLAISISNCQSLKFHRNSFIHEIVKVTANVLNEEDKRFLAYLKINPTLCHKIFPKLNYIYDVDFELLRKINEDFTESTYQKKTRCLFAKLLNIKSSKIYAETAKDEAFYDNGVFDLEKFERSAGYLLSEKLNSAYLSLNDYCKDNKYQNFINNEEFYFLAVNRSLKESIKENNKPRKF